MIKFMNKSINVKQKTNKASAISFTQNLLILFLSVLEICPANDGNAYVIFDKMRAWKIISRACDDKLWYLSWDNK